MGNLDFMKNIEGAIFDLDGTILDSSWVWDRVDVNFLGERGYRVPDNYVEEISPLGAEKAAVYTIERFGLKENPKDIVEEWFRMAEMEYAKEVVCKPFAKEYIKSLYHRGIELSVATSSDRRLFMSTLDREGILKYFSHIVTVDQVERGKGYPDIYIKAAEKMNKNSQQCVVYEDIYAGVSGAKKGGFSVIAVSDRKSLHNRKKIQKLADYYIDSFRELLT